jgi:hypothetical protein
MPPHIQTDLHERLASRRSVANVVECSPETRIAEEDVRIKQRRLGFMCLTSVESHDAFYADLKAYLGTGGRDPKHQQRVDEYAAFALQVYEQNSELILQRGIHYLIG